MSAHSPDDRFQALREAIQPTKAEAAEYGRHARVIEASLATVFRDCRLEVVGSRAHGTATRGASHLDLMLKIPRAAAYRGDQRVNANKVLDQVRQQLAEHFAATGLRRDRQAVVVNFGGGRSAIDIVPAIFDRMVKPFPNLPARPAYLIPDGDGDWAATSPETHDTLIGDADHESGGRVKVVAQMMKYWRDSRVIAFPLLSFHLELLLVTQGLCVGTASYQRCLADVFGTLHRRECRPLRDPLGISGMIKAAPTDAQREGLVIAVARAFERSTLALELEAEGKWGEASEQWDILFNRRLPAG